MTERKSAPFRVGYLIVSDALSISLQYGFRFFRFPIPAIPSAFLADRFLPKKRITGLPCSKYMPNEWFRSRLSAESFMIRDMPGQRAYTQLYTILVQAVFQFVALVPAC